MIEADFVKAEKLLRKILTINGIESEKVLEKIDDYFVVKKINIKRHRYFTFFKFGFYGMSQCMNVIR